MGAFAMRCYSLLVPLVALASCAAARAQTPLHNLGRTPSAEEIRAWDISINPEGKGLPPGSGTAKQGETLYEHKCARCHGKTGTEGPNEPLIGGQGTLQTERPVRTIGSFWPFATTIWDYINRGMPQYEEGSLSADQVYAITAFLLYRNGIIHESDVIDANSLPKIQMPNRNGFVPPKPEWKRREKRPFGIYH
ncbi:MAG: cytochrome c [Acidobacteria bacterium]|nr:cytochrome c [Acidobacteriota bacterium]